MTTKSFAIDIPQPSGYGYTELKILINKHTVRSAIIVGVMFIILFLLYSFFWNMATTTEAVKMAPIVKISVEDLPPPPADELADVAPPPPDQIIASGPASRAGTPVPVPDAEIKADLKDFAAMEELSRASAEGGDGVDLGNFADNIDWDAKKVDVQVREEEPAPDDFIAVEKNPNTDMAELQRLVVYPDMARKASVEGKVHVRALIDKNGAVKKTIIQMSDNQLLNAAAVEAVKKATWTPAIQNNMPVMCWVSVPITFKLR